MIPSIDYCTAFNALPGASALVLPDAPVFTVVASTDEFAAFGSASKEAIIGNSIFKFFPDNPDAPNVSDAIRASFLKCISIGKRNEIKAQRYDITNADGSFYEMYWTVIHTPVFNESGEISVIIHTAVDVTDRVLSHLKDEKIRTLAPAQNLFNQTEVVIQVFMGPDHIIELANTATLKLWNKDASIIGKPLAEVNPELPDNYIKYIDNIRLTGIPTQIQGAPIQINRGGKKETVYFNYVLQPYYEDGKTNASGVIAMMNEVTQMYRDKKALDEKERNLKLAVEIGDLGLFNIDLRSNIVNYSHQIMEWLGVGDMQMPLEKLIKIIHPEDRDAVNNTISGIVDGSSGRKHDLTLRVLHPISGEVRFLRTIGQVQIEEGEAVMLSGIIQDITLSVKSKLAFEHSAQRLKSFIDSAPFPIGVYTGKEMIIEMANQSILDAWGRTDSAIGKRYADVLPELTGQGIYEQLDAVFTTGKPFHAHNTRVDISIDGNLQSFYFNYNFTPLFDASGKVYGVMNTAADVTDLALAQKALKESERNFRTMILKAPVAICLLHGPEYSVEIANDLMINIWGKTAAQVINKPIFEALPDAKEQGLEQLLSHVYRSGETITAIERPVNLLRFGKQETVYLNFVYDAYRNGNGEIEGIMAVAIDVTDQILARFKIEEMVADRTKELEFSNSSLKKSNDELEQFAYIASHDLQEPLRKINMFTGLLQKSISENEGAQGYMNNIINSASRMTNLIRDILNYSQLSQKHDTFEKTNLEEIFVDATADFDIIVEEKSASITHSGLPVIDAIPLQTTQLFHNLISNALKYSRPDVAPEITIKSEKLPQTEAQRLGLISRIGAPYYRISFSDNGIGFSQEYADKIFNIFQRLHAKGKYEGTGIGLAMCKKIAENHHGMIYAESVEGIGTTFTIIFPSVQK